MLVDAVYKSIRQIATQLFTIAGVDQRFSDYTNLMTKQISVNGTWSFERLGRTLRSHLVYLMDNKSRYTVFKTWNFGPNTYII